MSVFSDSERSSLIPVSISLIDFTNLGDELAGKVLEWRNHESVRCRMRRTLPITADEHRNFLKNLEQDPSKQYYVVKLRGKPIGVIDFYRIDPAQRSCYFGYYLCPEMIGSSLGILLEFVAAEHALIEMELKQLIAETMPDNTPAMELHRASGFQNTIMNSSALQESVLSSKNWKERRNNLAAIIERLAS